ncbi:unnamed protein product [Discosporangium mesarthrocarpum]
MDFPASYEAMRPVVEHEFFDHRAVSQLEEYLEEQVKSNTYEFEANKALLKLYQFFPDLCKDDVVAKILAKALMNLPSTDFTALMYLVPPPLHRSGIVSALKRCSEALETAKFVDFWQVTHPRFGQCSFTARVRFCPALAPVPVPVPLSLPLSRPALEVGKRRVM